MGSNFLIYTVFTSLAMYLLILVVTFYQLSVHVIKQNQSMCLYDTIVLFYALTLSLPSTSKNRYLSAKHVSRTPEY